MLVLDSHPALTRTVCTSLVFHELPLCLVTTLHLVHT